jgi:acyl-CoA dehydrogenase
VADAGIQVHGGMGFIEETGAAQFARDVRVSAIYEGTTGIQGADLVGRKLSDGGAAAFALLDEAAETATAFGSDRLAGAVAAVREATETLVGWRSTTGWQVPSPMRAPSP